MKRQTSLMKRIGAFALIAIAISACNSESYYQGKLIGMAMIINKKCPQNVGAGVRMDSVTVSPHKTMEYHYTMLNIGIDDLDTTIFRKTVDSSLIAEVKRMPELKEFREHDVTLVYTYNDKNHTKIVSIPIAPSQYKDKK